MNNLAQERRVLAASAIFSKMKTMFSVFLRSSLVFSLAFVGRSEAACTIPVPVEFDLVNLAGTWYELAQYGGYDLQGLQNTTDSTLVINTLGSGDFTMFAASWDPSAKAWRNASGRGSTPDFFEPARLTVQFSDDPSDAGEYCVLYVDNNLAAIYTSLETDIYGWVLGRQPNTSPGYTQPAFDVIKTAANVDRTSFKTLSHGVAPANVTFDPLKFLGRWFEMYHVRNFDLAPIQGATDATIEFTPKAAFGEVSIKLDAWNPTNSSWITVRANGNFPDLRNKPNEMRVVFEDGTTGNFQILLNDEVAVIYQTDDPRMPSGLGWILARTAFPPSSAIDRAFAKLAEKNLQRPSFEAVVHGRAASPIPGQENYYPDLSKAIGNWFEIYHTPVGQNASSATDVQLQIAPSPNGNLQVQMHVWVAEQRKWMTLKAQAVPEDPNKLRITFESSESPLPNGGSIEVLAVDNDVMVWFTKEDQRAPQGLGWVFARSAKPSRQSMDQALTKLTEKGLPSSSFKEITHGLASEPAPSEEGPIMPSFDPQRFKGLWYELYRSRMFGEADPDTNTRILFTPHKNGSMSIVFTSWNPIERRWTGGQAFGRLINPNQPARFFFSNGADFQMEERILFTDYDQIAVVYSDPLFKFGRILVRNPNASQLYVDNALQVLQGVGIGRDTLQKVVHDNPPETGDTSPAIPPAFQPNFDLRRYAGQWYELYRIPDGTEGTTDSVATYTYNANATLTFRVRGWLRSNSEWDESRGIGRQEDRSQPARLNFYPEGMNGFSLEERVLFTDYDNIALIYSDNARGLAWIMVRRLNIDAATIDRGFERLSAEGFSKEDFVKVEHGVAPGQTTPRSAGTTPRCPDGRCLLPGPLPTGPTRLQTTPPTRPQTTPPTRPQTTPPTRPQTTPPTRPRTTTTTTTTRLLIDTSELDRHIARFMQDSMASWVQFMNRKQ